MTTSTDAAQLRINPFGRNVRLLLPAGFGRIGHGCRTRLSKIKRVGDQYIETSTPAARSLRTSRRHSVFPMVFLHVVDHEDFYWCRLSNLFLDRFKN
jgi:hypothetical protein